MDTSRKFWIPAGATLSRSQALILAIPSPHKPDPQMFKDQFGRKLQSLIDQLPFKEARAALELSPEHAPNL